MTSSARRKRKPLSKVAQPAKPGQPGPLTTELKRRGVLPAASKQRAVPPRGGTAPKRKA